MDQQDAIPGGASPILWHPAFVEALRLELEQYEDVLEFYPEYQLTTGPLQIDVVIIKKAKDVVIKKNIAAIFKTDNLVEFKSPGDYVSVEDFYKVYGYACLYAYLAKVPITGITLSFVESRYPRELLKHVRDVRNYTVENKSPGIYTVVGDILPIQVIDSRELSEDENLWLKDLSDRLDIPAINRVAAEVQRQGKGARLRAYLNAIAQANAETIREAMKMSNAAVTLEQVLEETGCIARAEARAEARGEERTKLEIAQNLIGMGFSLENIVSATQLDPDQIKPLYSQSQ